MCCVSNQDKFLHALLCRGGNISCGQKARHHSNCMSHTIDPTNVRTICTTFVAPYLSQLNFGSVTSFFERLALSPDNSSLTSRSCLRCLQMVLSDRLLFASQISKASKLKPILSFVLISRCAAPVLPPWPPCRLLLLIAPANPPLGLVDMINPPFSSLTGQRTALAPILSPSWHSRF